MSLGLQLQVFWSNPSVLAAVAIVVAVVTKTLHAKRKQVLEGRPPMVSHLIPWVGSALDVAADPDAFFDRARWVTGYRFARSSVADVFVGESTGTYLR